MTDTMTTVDAVAPGLHFNIPHDVYRAWPGMNYSRLKLADRSVAEFVWNEQHPREPSDEMKLGSAVDTLVHEPDKFGQTFIVQPDFNLRTKDGKAALAEWEAANVGLIAIPAGKVELAQTVAAAVKAHAVAGEILSSGSPQVCVVWADSETGDLCKARLDWLTTTRICDLKTARSVEQHAFASQMVELGYFMQAAFYSDGYQQATGKALAFTFIAVTNTAPHRVKVYEVEPETIAAGRHCYRRALHTLRACRQTGQWRDSECVETIQIPAWKLRECGIEPPKEDLGF